MRNAAIHLTRVTWSEVQTDRQRQRTSVLERLKFNGQRKKWQPFWNQFENATHLNSNLSPAERFNYLRSALSGDGAAAIAGLTAHHTVLLRRHGPPAEDVRKPGSTHPRPHGRPDGYFLCRRHGTLKSSDVCTTTYTLARTQGVGGERRLQCNALPGPTSCSPRWHASGVQLKNGCAGHGGWHQPGPITLDTNYIGINVWNFPNKSLQEF